MMTRTRFLSSLGLCLLAASSHAEGLWPEFRGPTAQGYSTAKGLPTEWAPDKNIVWRSEVAGKGWSSPVVANGKIFITTAVELPVDPAAAAAVVPEPVAPPPVAVAPKAGGFQAACAGEEGTATTAEAGEPACHRPRCGDGEDAVGHAGA
jgi:hypothetical protein